MSEAGTFGKRSRQSPLAARAPLSPCASSNAAETAEAEVPAQSSPRKRSRLPGVGSPRKRVRSSSDDDVPRVNPDVESN